MKKSFILSFLTLYSCLSFANCADEDIGIKLMISKMYSKESYLKIIDGYVENGKKERPELSEKYWQLVKKYYKYEDVIDHALPMYKGLFTEDEIKEIIAFYDTKAGAKLVESMPEIYDRWNKANQNLGREVQVKIKAELLE